MLIKKIILIILLFLSYINIVNAIPVPALIIGGDIILLIVPFVLGIFSTIYYYFKKDIYEINILLLILSIFLYFGHNQVTNEVLFYNYEYIIFIIIGIMLLLIFMYKSFFNLNYFITLFLVLITIFLIKIDYNLYKYKQINIKMHNNIDSNILLKHSLYKDNYMVIYAYDTETEDTGYVVIGKGKGVDHCEKRGVYHVCTGGSRKLGPKLSTSMYSSIN